MKTISKKKKCLYIALALLLTLVIASAAYLGSCYRADDYAIGITNDCAEKLTVNGVEVLLFKPDNFDISQDSPAYIFYPGGKVQPESYAPLCSELANKGIVCVLVKMPCNLAIMNTDAAEKLIPYIHEKLGCKDIYIGGHSLGGAAAGMYAFDNPSSIKGLILLAAYSKSDLSPMDLSVLSIYGSEDGVLSMDTYEASVAFMPNFSEVVIDGGCHAYFGYYGEQKGDGTAAISREEQIAQTADAVAAWLGLD